ncbi:ribosomal protein S5 domain 2-like protein [Linderina pennispora]|uniref:Exosome complex component RRP45 n=1 Tax=Linderina pennispora TaxID=61395 RepID=A0A1Y1WMZ0_9FUNG|nr:ribosomal protein S5 domain 2-like protein [Linderina pennispora]ORX74911.1 ribosomal protein S5 domain 2-like protein [Linderina pennispora]
MVVEIGPSNIESQFALDALRQGIRVDGRGIYDYRTLKIACGPTPGLVEVQLGETRVLARVSCEVSRPFPDRPTEGIVQFNAELSSMAAPGFDSGRPSTQEVAVARMIERTVKQSRAIDAEALCILAGDKVWAVRVDLHFLSHSGNLIDAASIAAITALKHFKRPDVTVDGEEAIIHDPRDRNPVPLSIHHTPICVTFGFLGDGELMVVDPSLLEEQVQVSSFTITLNAHREICALSKAGGVPLDQEQIDRCTQLALTKVEELNEKISEAIKSAVPDTN